MNKIISLIKVSLSHDMNIFKIQTKKQNKLLKVLLPLIITLYLMGIVGYYSLEALKFLKPLNLEFVVITLFAMAVSMITLIEGIYKSSSLLFNCKDDNLMFSLPIKKSTILFIRILKFYIFELLYNTLFFLPAIIVYAYKMTPEWTYYLSSFVALLLLPIVPIALSCIIGFIITYLSSKFKGKNIFQTIFTTLFLICIFYISYNMNNYVSNIVKKAASINDLITRIYYPVGAYITLINDFNFKTLFIYIVVHLAIMAAVIYVLGKVYYNINSSNKKVTTSNKNKNYIIKTRSKSKTFIKKELSKFVSTPVFITNAGFGLVLFILGCIIISVRFTPILDSILKSDEELNKEIITSLLPIFMFAFVCFSSFMTSITSSMISLEGQSFSILKSLPIKPFKIVIYKVITALLIIIPCLLIGDIIIFIRFKFNIISILLILIASIVLPILTEMIGIIANLKYPKMDATNDTEIVKQSMSSMISVFTGMGLVGLTIIILYLLLKNGLETNLVITIILSIYSILCILLYLLLKKNCDKMFNNINV